MITRADLRFYFFENFSWLVGQQSYALSKSYESMRILHGRLYIVVVSTERVNRGTIGREREREREKKEGERFNLTRSGTTFVTRASATCTKLEEVNGKLSSLISKAVARSYTPRLAVRAN